MSCSNKRFLTLYNTSCKVKWKMENKNWKSSIFENFRVPTVRFYANFSYFTQSYQGNVGEMLDIWNYRKFRPAASCHVISDLKVTNKFSIRTSDMLKTSPNIL